ncbi:MAG: non-canonical purine NTP pyrophosphatase, partial [Candidatus Methylomirabilales bacterium]
MIDEIVIASSNRAKIVEISQILSHLPIGILAAAELGSPSPVEETGASYLENARIKARAVVEATGRPALAEDSGLEVDALGGGPGIRSARLAGPDATDEENNAQLISLMAGAPEGERRACYRCVAVALFPDGTE